MTTVSIETRAVAALAAVQRIGEGMPGMHPMRHCVRSLKGDAVEALSEAFIRAHRLADIANGVMHDHDKAVKEGGEA